MLVGNAVGTIFAKKAKGAPCFGLVAEHRMAPRNLLKWSEQFDNAAWTKVNAVIDANGLVTVTAGSHLIAQNVTVTPLTNYVFSFFAKSNIGTLASYSVYDNTGAVDIIPSTSYQSRLNTRDYVRWSSASSGRMGRIITFVPSLRAIASGCINSSTVGCIDYLW
jgi:hypothetical protein